MRYLALSMAVFLLITGSSCSMLRASPAQMVWESQYSYCSPERDSKDLKRWGILKLAPPRTLSVEEMDGSLAVSVSGSWQLDGIDIDAFYDGFSHRIGFMLLIDDNLSDTPDSGIPSTGIVYNGKEIERFPNVFARQLFGDPTAGVQIFPRFVRLSGVKEEISLERSPDNEDSWQVLYKLEEFRLTKHPAQPSAYTWRSCIKGFKAVVTAS